MPFRRVHHPNSSSDDARREEVLPTSSPQEKSLPGADDKIQGREDLLTRRKPPNLTGLALLGLSYQGIGIIYADLVASPLYVLNGVWEPTGPPPSKEDVIGVVSCIIWALIILPLVKYCGFALHFGTEEGEGGVFALYQGLLPPLHSQSSADDSRVLTGDSYLNTSRKESRRDNLRRFNWLLLPWALFGTGLTIADGIFTPAVSITSAVSGIAINAPQLADDIVPISIVFLLILFVGQPFGTARISVVFSPILLLWMIFIGICGAINIASYPGILRAFDPSRAVELFIRTRDYDLLAGILLCLTGCEALFANLGQFNALSIQLTFCLICLPSVTLAYLGEGARLIVDGPNVITSVFYKSVPGPSNGPLFWIMYVLAILSTFVASQALITAAFSIMQQVVNMKCFPPLRMKYTSDSIQGQVYIAAVNWSLTVITIVVVAVFGTSQALTNAFGFACATVMFTSTVLMGLSCRYLKNTPWVVAIAFLLTFGFFDGLFWGAALRKVPHGAWVPLTIGCILGLFMLFWTWAKGLEDAFDGMNRKNLRHVIRGVGERENEELETEHGHPSQSVDILPRSSSDVQTNLEVQQQGSNGINVNVNANSRRDGLMKRKYYLSTSGKQDDLDTTPLTTLPILAVFHKFAAGRGIPHSFVRFLRQYPALPQVVVFLTVQVMPVPRVPLAQRYVVSKVKAMRGFYGVTCQKGYREDFEIDMKQIVEDICQVEREAVGVLEGAPMMEDEMMIRRVAQRTTHIIPHYDVVSKDVGTGKLASVINFTRCFLIETLYRRLAKMFPETENWLTPSDEMIHVGITARI